MDDGGKLPLMAQTPPDEEIGDALRVARETLPSKEYKPFNVLPLREDEQGVHFDPYSGALGAVTRPFRYFKETMTGEKPMDVTSPEAIQSAADLGSAMTLGSGAFESPEGALRAGIKAYHGSPHLFAPTERNPLGEFDLSKIGTGEGAQVFGHGVYLADLEDVANEYRYIGSNINPDIVKYNGKTIQQHYDSALKEQDRARRLNDRKAVTNADAKAYFWENLMTGNHPKQVLDTALKDIEEWPELVSYASSIDPEKFSGVGKAGHMYEAEIAAEPHQLLDWYKPLKAQPEMVERVSSVLPNETLLNDWKKSGALLHAPFASIYKGAAGGSRADVSAGRPAEFSRKLKESGIPGIQYLDAGSRGAGEGTHNYVIFDPSIIDIKRRYSTGGKASGKMNDDTIQDALRIANSRLGRADGGEIPTPPRRPDDLEHYAVMADAQKKFPFINKYDPHIKVEPREDAGYAETYGPKETGDPKDPSTWRPEEFPYGSTGVRVYRPEEFTPADYAAEYLHVDPVANKTREELINRLTPDQLAILKHQPDYLKSIKTGQSEEKALQNVVDGVLRGYTMKDESSHQWPKEALAELEFTPEELELLNSLQDYVEAPAEAAQGSMPQEPAPVEEMPARKLGGKINTIIDRDPDWRMGLEEGGLVDHALKLSRDHMAYGGLPDSYMDDDRYKTFQQMGGTRTDPRAEAMGRYLPKMIAQESGGNPTLKNPRSTAAGLGQFIKGTWRKMTAGEPEIAGKTQREIDEMRRSATPEGQELQKRMMEKFTMGNADILQKKGIPLTPANLYALHFAGENVGPRALTAPAKTPVRQLFKPEAITANPFLRGMNAGQFRKWTEKVIEKRPGSVTRGILPLDMDFQRSQSPTNRYEGLQTAMAGAQQQPWQVAAAPQQTSPTQMAYAQPQQRGFSADLMTPHPVPQPTRMAHLPDMQVGGQRMMAADRGLMAGGSGSGVPETQMAMAQPIPQQEPQIEQAAYQPEPERPNQDMLEGIEQPFVGWPDFDIAGLFADGGVVGDALRLATGGRTPAWQRKEGKNPKGGLNAKGRASAKAEGMNLKPPAPHPKTEKDAKRRKSFCARMSNMPGPMKDEKGKPTRKALSLRVWNCADGGQVWDKPRPKHLGEPEPLSAKQKKSAKAAAKAAGRPWPNMIDSMRAAQKKK